MGEHITILLLRGREELAGTQDVVGVLLDADEVSGPDETDSFGN